MVQNCFVFRAQRTNEHGHYVCTFMAEVSSGPARLVLAAVPLIMNREGLARSCVSLVTTPASIGAFCCGLLAELSQFGRGECKGEWRPWCQEIREVKWKTLFCLGTGGTQHLR